MSRRALSLAHQSRETADARPQLNSCDKWELLSRFEIAAPAFGLSHREMGVLRALLSLHSPRVLDSAEQLIVFASNRTIAERAQNMPESTMRRHIARLIETGFLGRRDSANCKRFRIKSKFGAVAFGLDLTPLLSRAPEIHATADAVIAEQAERKAVTADIRAVLADVETLDPAHCTREERLTLRRKTGLNILKGLLSALCDIRARLLRHVEKQSATEKTSTSISQNEQHQQNPKTDIITPAHVLAACPDMLNYADRRITSWNDLAEITLRIAPMMGLDPRVLISLVKKGGTKRIAMALCLLLQRFESVRNPTGYLTSLISRESLDQEFMKLTAVN
ncbi:hypothetical protein POI8812_03473 [Pontivivens insulae]|uniref:Uncharacterized protein n=2 Tax=Pontivivens insulae TaxID=1639689 RepID=A0A2R8AFU2_9RHOB|nr:replication initiation protein RepC [Pontivivens insulae]SPF31122.1 hypothetical protein POI8812_03473 [Pontivivens insulae]